MNPSAQDWIKKFLSTYKEDVISLQFTSKDAFYDLLNATGFLYGNANSLILKHDIDLALSHQECTKVNLFHALLYTGISNTPSASPQEVISTIVKYYKALDKAKTGFLKAIIFSSSETSNLESILSKRLHEINTVNKTNAVSLLTYALLYVDVLAFEYWLSKGSDSKVFTKNLELQTMLCCFGSLNAKQEKTQYDSMLISLFEASSQYKDTEQSLETANRKENFEQFSAYARKYILDVSTLAVWENKPLDLKEHIYLEALVNNLELDQDTQQKSIDAIKAFSLKTQGKVSLFEYATPIKQFYTQSTSTVKRLIVRNKDRLQKELQESGELLKLLGISTYRELSKDEKSKVKEQLLDICKTIPSLTIFLLPGGAILLPLLVKLIPKLLPSAFDENRVD
ncbi:LETM1-related biofilm-associated protein [Flavobacteriaceae bacterium]|nr:LETM1-related biofilm-associated protein [Flavobacteriaceae bacterium]MDA9780839.1 LETM1-related biofilm-associated protein [Flavobacteriaceae bacterium]